MPRQQLWHVSYNQTSKLLGSLQRVDILILFCREPTRCEPPATLHVISSCLEGKMIQDANFSQSYHYMCWIFHSKAALVRSNFPGLRKPKQALLDEKDQACIVGLCLYGRRSHHVLLYGMVPYHTRPSYLSCTNSIIW